MEAAVVEVTRDVGGLRDYLRVYQVVIDGKVVGKLAAGESQAFEVDPGSHVLFLTIDWCRSNKVTLKLEQGQRMAFRCAPNGNPLTEFYWISLGRHRYIVLSEVRPENVLPG